MRYRRIALLIAIYVTFDLTNPFVGCAFNFNAEEAIDGVSRQGERALHQPAAVALPRPSGSENTGLARPTPASPFLSRALLGWSGQLRQGHASHSDPQSPTEDH
jgi:hypothetical protein